MRRWAVVLSALTVSLGAATAVTGTAANAGNDNDPYTLSDGHAQAGPMGGIVPARDVDNAAKPGGGGGRGPNLIGHGGPVLHGTTQVTPIYWGAKWANSSFVDDKITGLQTFYGGLDGSPYMKTNSEYTDSNGHVGTGVAYNKEIVDTSAAPSGAPSTSTILAEVERRITNPVPDGYYPVYVDTPRGRTGYCAWHSTGLIGSTRVQFAFFFNLDGDSGCDPRSPSSLGHHQGLSALANVSGHELSETATDPQLNAWYDQQGAENADKCAWHFGGTETLSNGSTWLIQGNWSNSAYTAQSGYYNYGCIISSS